jgi:hypothetical protein
MLPQHARDLIRAGAGGERHHDLDLPVGVIAVGRKGLGHRRSEQQQADEDAQSQCHIHYPRC